MITTFYEEATSMVYINDRNVLCQIREAAIVPVVVLDDAKDAVPTAKEIGRASCRERV